jgi:1-aminocyclopropane-1-carboxylate deaminase/D-cysteine desulfhydrase-like pyridoxal-dependent ACC family enzyme
VAVTFRRFGLGVLPTPLTRAQRLERALGAAPLWIKRDDLTGFATAGTKTRPLEFLIGDALVSGATVVVATGSPSSNFCAVAALAARTAGLDCEVLYAGSRPTPPPYSVRLATAAGARLFFDPTLKRDDLDAAVNARAATLGPTAYPLPRGGATPVGALGCAYAARELSQQLPDQPATVVVATGSGGTQAGLVAGVVRFGLPFRVIGASVSRSAMLARVRVLALAQACAHLMRSAEPRAFNVDIRDRLGPGFGIAADDDRQSATLALGHEGLLLDDTYTAKSMSLVRELVRTGVDGPIVFWHTGGQAAALQSMPGGDSE